MTGHPDSLTDGITVLERGWLSSNNILLHADERHAVLVDSGHCVHAAQTVDLVRHALRGAALVQVLNTHLHSDHCGGNAALQDTFGASVQIPPNQWSAVLAWDEQALSYAPTRQRCVRFVPQGTIEPGQTLTIGARHWQVLGAPGHDPDSVMLFDAEGGVLISADALWENGFGVVFPELDGVRAFDEVGEVLDLIASLPVRRVIPGHGAPFSDVQGALGRARRRLDGFVADPCRHMRHAAKVLLKYHLLEEGRQALDELDRWTQATPLLQQIWQRMGRPDDAAAAWGRTLVGEMEAIGALVVRDGVVHNT